MKNIHDTLRFYAPLSRVFCPGRAKYRKKFFRAS